jgi:hypothetical protein
MAAPNKRLVSKVLIVGNNPRKRKLAPQRDSALESAKTPVPPENLIPG